MVPFRANGCHFCMLFLVLMLLRRCCYNRHTRVSGQLLNDTKKVSSRQMKTKNSLKDILLEDVFQCGSVTVVVEIYFDQSSWITT